MMYCSIKLGLKQLNSAKVSEIKALARPGTKDYGCEGDEVKKGDKPVCY